MGASKRKFKTEVNKLLDLMIHSLYSHKEIFLRELISNASDAIDKVRYEALTDEAVREADEEWRIQLIPEPREGTLTVRDNGIGMTREEIIEALGTIAHSGTKEFLQYLESRDVKDNPELIGQFGVGFYSAFMVADQVTVRSRRAGAEPGEAVEWQSAADGTYTVRTIEKPSRGTDVILKLKEEEREYLEEWEIRSIVKRYSDFIEYPVIMEVSERQSGAEAADRDAASAEEVVLNSRKAIWLRDKDEVSQEEYAEFYKHISHDFADPARVIHYRAEGTREFSALLYIPQKAPFNLFFKDGKFGPMLYVRRVQIMDHCEELLPPYLRFVCGVVESADLPLNVSREILQNSRMVEVIRRNLTKKVLDTLAEMKADDAKAYQEFYREFGRVLKEGVHFESDRRQAVADLLLFESTATESGSPTTLAEYVERMAEGQEAIYFITGPSSDVLASSPYLETFRSKGYEVLFATDDIDDLILSRLGEYREKPLQSVIKGELDLDRQDSEKSNALDPLIQRMKTQLSDLVGDVRVSGRLKTSAVCLVLPESGVAPQMERMLKALGQEVPENKRILEINPDHELIREMNAMAVAGKEEESLEDYVSLLYDQALLIEGSRPRDPVDFARKVAQLMAREAGAR